MPPISVIVPVYNGRARLARCLDSVLAQSFRDFEIIVADDASTDETPAIAARYQTQDPRIVALRSPVNEGVHGARNRGMARASGEILVFLDGDDELRQGALQLCLDAYVRPERPDVVFAPGVTADGAPTGLNITQSGPIPFEDLLCERVFHRRKQGFVSFRRAAIGDRKWLATHCDGIFWTLVQKDAKTYGLAEALLFYHVEKNPHASLTALRKNPRHIIRHAASMAEAYKLFHEEFGASLRDLCPWKFLSGLRALAVASLLSGRRRWALSSLVSSFLYKPHWRTAALLPLVPLPGFLVRRLYAAKGSRG